MIYIVTGCQGYLETMIGDCYAKDEEGLKKIAIANAKEGWLSDCNLFQAVVDMEKLEIEVRATWVDGERQEEVYHFIPIEEIQ
ncbi:MAG: hypothetical protein ACYS7Y_04425 [Planctomycetota bacterium]|jgi:hypothetical protein